MKKKVYLPVIAYGGVCRAEYSMSMASLFVKCVNDHPEVSFLSTGIFFESLVSRARNSAAAAALHYGTDYLLFIDSDVVFDAKDVFKLLAHDKDIVSGIYPKKYLNTQKINHIASSYQGVFKDNSWRSLATDFATEINPSFLNKVSRGDKLVEVDYAATGFMLIKTIVFREIIKAKPELKYKNEVDGYMSWGDNFYNFFPSHVNPVNKKYESEDYGFCNLWRSLGGKIWTDPSINLQHVGNFAFEGNIKQQAQMYASSPPK